MKNSIRISVKKPCSKKFENFATTLNGGFCDSCHKEVIDFTTFSDEEVIQHFTKSDGETCGRFKKSQCKTYQTNQVMNSNFLSKGTSIMAFSLLTMIAISTVQAQDVAQLKSSLSTEINTVETSEKVNSILAEKYMVTGIVLDEEDLPLAGVNVVLKGTTEGVQTDFDGKFEFPRALEVDDTLVFSYIGYGKKEYTISASESETIDITIQFNLSDIELMGEIMVGGAYKTKRNIFQRFISLFK